MSASENNIAVGIYGVSKEFRLPSEKYSSLKSHIIHPLKRRSFKHQTALNNISLEIKKGEFFGIVGRNGSGKSTLLKMIAGIYQPTKGRLVVNGKLVPFIELGVGFNPELTGRENVYLNGALLGFSEKEITAMYEDIVAFAELGSFMGQKLKNYSSGMHVRLAFSMAVRAKADVLLIDEVLAVGDADFQRKCFDYFKKLKKEQTTVIFVSHNMDAIREFCDRAMLIEKSKVVDIGKTDIVSQKYSQLFIETPTDSPPVIKEGDRWGNKKVVVTQVKTEVGDKEISINVWAEASQVVDKVIYGLHVLASDGTEITAMNNRMIHQADITDLMPGQKVCMEWKMLNIFNDGTYFITVTLIDEGANTLDWYAEASKFTVKRIERSTTSVLPPVTVQVSKSAADKVIKDA
jgi:ABC-2 type transport system ATP-binding protein